MFDLLLAIIFSAMIPIILKLAHRRNLDDEVILTFNYVIATTISVIFFAAKYMDYQEAIISNQTLIPLIIIGVVTGCFYYSAFYFYQKSVKDNGVSLSIAVGKMGIIIPMLLSLLLWKEIPTVIQWIGISVSVLAIAIINVKPKDFKHLEFKTSLLLFFIIGGLGDFSNKLFEVVVGSDAKELFLIVVFLSAFLASLYKTIKIKNITPKSIIFGFCVGIPNMLTAYFLIKTLGVMNATVVFPLYSGGAIMLSMIWSMLAFKEKLMVKDYVGIVLIITALVLINI